MRRIVVVRESAAEPLGAHVLALRDLGNEVHLLGGGEPSEDGPVLIDGVHVTTTPVHGWLGRGSHAARSPRWTRPLGYRLMMKATVRQAAATARVSEAQFRRDVALARSGRTRTPLTARIRLFAARIERRWVAARVEDTREAYALRRKRRRRVDEAGRRWWRRVSRQHAWARLDPGLLDAEVQLGPLLDGMEADVIHAEGAVMMSVAVRAAARRDRRPLVVWDSTEEFEPRRPWVVEARRLLVAEYRDRVDATITSREADTLAAAYAALSRANPTREGIS